MASLRRWLAGGTAFVAVFVLLAGWVSAGQDPASDPGRASGRVTLSIVGTTDLHGRVFPRDGHGGVALLGGYLRNLRAARAADGGAVLLLDAGDTFQGGVTSDISEGLLVVDAYNALGYDALAIGNHEFEYGAVDTATGPEATDMRGALKAAAARARFPFLAANVIDTATGRPVAWPNVRPSAIVGAAGLRVGIVGVMTSDGLRRTLAANVEGLATAALAPTVEREARRLRRRGADLVLVLAHAGGECARFDDPADLASCDADSEIFQLARRLPAGLVDGIVAGHSHRALAHEVAGIPIVQAWSWGRAFARLDLTVERGAGVVSTRLFPPRLICAAVAPDGSCATGGAAPASADAAPVPPEGAVTSPQGAAASREGTAASAVAVAASREGAPASYEGAAASHEGAPASYEGAPVRPDASIVAAMQPELDRVNRWRSEPLGITLETRFARNRDGVESAVGNLFADAMRAAVPDADLAIGMGARRGGLRAGLPAGRLTRGPLYDVFPFDNRIATLVLTGVQVQQALARRLTRGWGGIPSVSGVRVRVACHGPRPELDILWPSGEPVAPTATLIVATTDFFAARAARDAAITRREASLAMAPLVRDAVAAWLTARGGRLRAADLTTPPRWEASAGGTCLAGAVFQAGFGVRVGAPR